MIHFTIWQKVWLPFANALRTEVRVNLKIIDCLLEETLRQQDIQATAWLLLISMVWENRKVGNMFGKERKGV